MITVTIRTNSLIGERATECALKIITTTHAIARAAHVRLAPVTVCGAELPTGELLRVECDSGHRDPCECPLCQLRDAMTAMLIAAAQLQDRADRDAAERRSAAASVAAQARWAGRHQPSGVDHV